MFWFFIPAFNLLSSEFSAVNHVFIKEEIEAQGS